MTPGTRPAYVLAMCDVLRSEQMAVKGAIHYDKETGVSFLFEWSEHRLA